MGRVVIASNRLPISISVDHDGAPFIKEGEGGLVTGLKGVQDAADALWLGYMGDVDSVAIYPIEAEYSGLRAVRIPDDLYDMYYKGGSNEMLWPLLHGMTDRARFSNVAWSAYGRVNEIFAQAIISEVRDGDTVWVHDYHLALLPKLLKDARKDIRVGFFLHVPFPDPETFSLFPWSEELLEGLLGADLIGFHTQEYVDRFQETVNDQLGDVEVNAAAFPLGIDVSSIHEEARSPECLGRLDQLKEFHAGQRVILGVDRMDYIKGIPEKISAFHDLLRSHPELIGNTVLVQVAVPSREGIEAYQQVREKTEELVERVNQEMGGSGYTPVRYLYSSVPKPLLLALYRLADIMLITSLADGLNLVAKEYVAAKGLDDIGALVLSGLSGAAQEMDRAVIIDPRDKSDIVDGIVKALRMTDREKLERSSTLYNRLQENDNVNWSRKFLSELNKACH